MRKSIRVLSLIALGAFLASGAVAQHGKISGQVVEEETGQPIPGANVVIVGTQTGTTTNANGQYTLLNVDPGTYDVRASSVGFENQTVEGVEVSIDLTTEVNFELPEETVGMEGVTIQAEERVVQQDLSASRVDIDSENLENLPVTDVQSVVGLQAGDIIPLDWPETLEVCAEEMPVFRGRLGTSSGKHAIQITDFIRREQPPTLRPQV